MEAGGAELAALVDVGTAGAHALQEGDDDGRLAQDRAQRLAILARNRQRGGKSFLREVGHHAHEERQVLRLRALFEDGEDVAAGRRLEQEVRILHALRNPLEGERGPEVVLGEQRFERRIVDVGIDGHDGWLGRRSNRQAKGLVSWAKVTRLRGGHAGAAPEAGASERAGLGLWPR